ncbi:MAG: ribonuclease P protein component [Planctomycetes bacterium]|nr:ribonuclease P protein component [Planctomycetota bacterium]
MANLSRQERLRGRERISEIFDQGGKSSARNLAVIAIANHLDYSRLLAVAGKGLGNAVLRNRLRRRIRAAFRQHKQLLPAGYDFAIMARRGLAETEWPEVTAQMIQAANKAVNSPAPAVRTARNPSRSAAGQPRSRPRR